MVLNLTVKRGESVSIIGSSGSGKSTLLHLLAGLDMADSGTVHIGGQDVSGLSEQQRDQMRNSQLGFVYQFHHLLPEFTAVENVAMPLLIRREKPQQVYLRAQELLQQVGLEERYSHTPSELSGGERQRVAIARALAGKPQLILADEPTGNLDEGTAEEVLRMLLSQVASAGLSLVMVTHNMQLSEHFDRVCRLHQGRLQEVN